MARADHILELMALEAGNGTLVEIRADGEEEETAALEVANILRSDMI